MMRRAVLSSAALALGGLALVQGLQLLPAGFQMRAFAAERGWLPPLAWDDIDTDPEPQHHARRVEKDDDLDEIAIERALAGDGVRLEHLTSAEQEEVVRRLTERGKSIHDIAQQLATTKRTISRRRASISAA